MIDLSEFVNVHMSDDTTRLLLDKARWPEIDMDLAVNCIESRRKLRTKVPEWYKEPMLVFPRKLSAEQCSSSATGRYKSSLAERIALSAGKKENEWNLADLTGGLGVDSWFFSKKAAKVLYNEMHTELCTAAKHNFSVLNAGNIEISNHAVTSSKSVISGETGMSPDTLLSAFKPDIIFMDPARRGEGGRKVFLIEECTPDVLILKDELFDICSNILLKLSPMADVTMVCDRLGRQCREVHIVSAGSECKELLVWMDKEWSDEYSVHAVELDNDDEHHEFIFRPSEEKAAIMIPCMDPMASFLFEPRKSLMKSGAFNLISERFGIAKLGRSTHYYTVDSQEIADELKPYGKIFRIIRVTPLDKRSIKAAGKEFPIVEVTARNIPMDTETLRKKLGVTSGSDTHIFGLKSDTQGNLLMVTTKVL